MAAPIRLSSRVPADEPNDLTLARDDARRRGVALTELTDSNPTRHGLMDPGVMQAVGRHLAEAAEYVPDPRGWPPARAALAQRFGGHPDDYWLTSSTSEAYSWLFTALADPGDAVAVPVPGYPLVEPLARLASLRTVAYPAVYLHPHGWELDLASVDAAVDQARVVVAVNPNNPTGAYLARDQAARLGASCETAGVPLIADEVFFPFTLDHDAAPGRLADAAGPDTVVLTLDGLSKLLAAPQLKLSWIRLSGPSELTSPIADALDTVGDAFLSVNSPVACALPELLGMADATVDRITSRCRTNLAALGGLGDGFRVRRTQGGWTALLDVPRTADDGDLARRLLDAGLAVHPGWFYDLSSQACLAVSLLPEPAAFARAIDRLRAAITG